MIKAKISSVIWAALLILVFFRPFLSEYTFLSQGFVYILALIFCSLIYLFLIDTDKVFALKVYFLPLGFAIAILLSIICCGYNELSAYEFFLFIPGIIFFYVVSKINNEQQKQLVKIMFFSACLIAIYGIYQYFIGFDHVLQYLKSNGNDQYWVGLVNRKRIFATIISPNIFASYTIMMLFLSMGLANQTSRGKKLIYWSGVIVLLAALLLSKSLGGILAFIILFPAFYLITRYYKETKVLNLKRLGLILLFVLGVLVLTYVFFARERMALFLDLKNPDNSFIQRLYYWKASFKMIQDHPLLGVGWRKSWMFYQSYKDAAANMTYYSHNVFLQIMAELGVIGLAIFLGIIFTFLRNGIRIITDKSAKQPLRIGLFFAACAFLIHNFIEISFYFSQVAFFWWIILGLFVNYSSENA